jgi:hypothetical protein
LRLTDDYMSITIVNSAWIFEVEYEVDDSGLCRVTCRRLCAVLWGGAVPTQSREEIEEITEEEWQKSADLVALNRCQNT